MGGGSDSVDKVIVPQTCGPDSEPLHSWQSQAQWWLVWLPVISELGGRETGGSWETHYLARLDNK